MVKKYFNPRYALVYCLFFGNFKLHHTCMYFVRATLSDSHGSVQLYNRNLLGFWHWWIVARCWHLSLYVVSPLFSLLSCCLSDSLSLFPGCDDGWAACMHLCAKHGQHLLSALSLVPLAALDSLLRRSHFGSWAINMHPEWLVITESLWPLAKHHWNDKNGHIESF